MISRKYEEISPPHVEDFCYITDNTYTKEEVIFLLSGIGYPIFAVVLLFLCFLFKTLIFFFFFVKVVKMEADLLDSFKFELGNPTVKTFLRQVS